MKVEEKFKTKKGYCHVLTDKIVLTRDGIIGNVGELTTGKKINRTIVIYSFVAVISLFNAYKSLMENHWLFFTFQILFGIYMIVSLFKSFELSTTPVIERNRIIDVQFEPERKFLTRSYFKVNFEQNDGKKKSRLIMLPSSLKGGTKETEKALEIMKSAGLINNNVG